MTTKAQHRRLEQRAELEKTVIDHIRSVGRKHGLSRVWSDFVEMGAIALARLDKQQFDTREKRYLQIVSVYDRPELDSMVEAFAMLVAIYERDWPVAGDVLGRLYMGLDLGNADTGQFFTPYEVSVLMAKICMTGAKELIERRGYVRMCEPAAGAGGMILAAAQALHEDGINYQKHMHVTAIDVDARCVHMCFIQLALAHIPAIVVHGNALTMETWQMWGTPAHFMGGWTAELATPDDLSDDADVPHQVHTVGALPASLDVSGVKVAVAKGQMTLF